MGEEDTSARHGRSKFDTSHRSVSIDHARPPSLHLYCLSRTIHHLQLALFICKIHCDDRTAEPAGCMRSALAIGRMRTISRLHAGSGWKLMIISAEI